MRFSVLGRRYDENGNLRQWWSDETLRHYHEKVQCIIEQYNSYHLPELGDNFTVSAMATCLFCSLKAQREKRAKAPLARALNHSTHLLIFR